MLFINGKWRKGRGETFSSSNPADGTEIWSGASANADDVDDALAAAQAAFIDWRRRPISERVEILTNFTEKVKDNKEALARTISRETGKALWDAQGEVAGMIGKLGLSQKAYDERTGIKSSEAAGTEMRVSHKPHGVMVVMGPYNFPGHLPNGHIVPALLAGNCVVFKPSELTPLVAEETVKLWEQAGLPAGVLNLLQGARPVGERLVAHDKTDGVLFTGGVPTGLAIHKALAGKPEKILALELGGNNPLIVWNAADHEAAARVIVRSAFISAGQRCTCARRLIIEDGENGEALVAALTALSDKINVGQPDADPQPFMGSLISRTAADNALAAQKYLLSNGAIALREMKRAEAGPAFLTPGLIDVTGCKDNPDTEIFAPLLKIIRVKNFDDAIAAANDTKFGLAAGLLSDERHLWEQFSVEIDAGVVNWNRQTTGASGAAPFGGVGHSGNHRPAGYYAADYCAWPMASLLGEGPLSDEVAMIGIDG